MSKGRAFLTPDTEPDGVTCVRLFVPSGGEWADLARGALAQLLHVTSWEEYGSVSVADTVQYWQEALALTFEWGACMPVGAIIAYAGNPLVPPDGWLWCAGQSFLKADYPELYQLTAGLYGPFSPTEGYTPNLQRRFILGYQLGTYDPGYTGGAETHTLTVDEMPAHDHTVDPHTHSIPGSIPATFQVGAGAALAPNPLGDVTGSASPDTDEAGGGDPHNNMPPYMVLGWLIRAKP